MYVTGAAIVVQPGMQLEAATWCLCHVSRPTPAQLLPAIVSRHYCFSSSTPLPLPCLSGSQKHVRAKHTSPSVQCSAKAAVTTAAAAVSAAVAQPNYSTLMVSHVAHVMLGARPSALPQFSSC
jgi:hypothetical protein